jgi:hypothetical protein
MVGSHRYISEINGQALMKPLPAPNVPGKTEFERFDNAMRQVLSVSKEELLKRETNWKHGRAARKKRAKKL